MKTDIEEVFAYWQSACGHARSTLTAERKKKIAARLKRYPPEQIKEAIDGCVKSPFHQGQNDRRTVYDDIELICRNDTMLERFIALNEKTGVKPHGKYAQRIADTNEIIDRLLASGSSLSGERPQIDSAMPSGQLRITAGAGSDDTVDNILVRGPEAAHSDGTAPRMFRPRCYGDERR